MRDRIMKDPRDHMPGRVLYERRDQHGTERSPQATAAAHAIAGRGRFEQPSGTRPGPGQHQRQAGLDCGVDVRAHGWLRVASASRPTIVSTMPCASLATVAASAPAAPRPGSAPGRASSWRVCREAPGGGGGAGRGPPRRTITDWMVTTVTDEAADWRTSGRGRSADPADSAPRKAGTEPLERATNTGLSDSCLKTLQERLHGRRRYPEAASGERTTATLTRDAQY